LPFTLDLSFSLIFCFFTKIAYYFGAFSKIWPSWTTPLWLSIGRVGKKRQVKILPINLRQVMSDFWSPAISLSPIPIDGLTSTEVHSVFAGFTSGKTLVFLE
jgi:hypothetical protein